MKALYIAHSGDLICWSFTAKHGPFIVGHSAMKSSTILELYFCIADKWAPLCWSAHLRNLIVLSADHFNRQVDRAVLMAVVWLCGVIHEDCGAGDVLDNECLWAVHIQMKSVLSPSIIHPSVL